MEKTVSSQEFVCKVMLVWDVVVSQAIMLFFFLLLFCMTLIQGGDTDHPVVPC